jgi:hypothetical protein
MTTLEYGSQRRLLDISPLGFGNTVQAVQSVAEIETALTIRVVIAVWVFERCGVKVDDRIWRVEWSLLRW